MESRAIQIWPHRDEVVVSNQSRRSNLIRAYGGGKLLDSQNRVVLEEVIGEGYFTYIVGFPDDIVAAVDKDMQFKLFQEPTSDRANFINIFLQLQPSCSMLFEVLSRVTNGAWQSGLVNAVREDGARGLADYMSCSPWPTVVPELQIRGAVHQGLVESWTSPYEDTAGVLDFVYSTLNRYVEQYWNSLRYRVPWTWVVQSSGWGKSRTIIELHRKDVYVIYVSFMPEDKGGFPRGSAVVELLTEVTPRHLMVWLVAMLAVLADSKKTPEEWKNWQETWEYFDEVKLKMAKFTQELPFTVTPAFTGNKEWDVAGLRHWAGVKIQDLVHALGWRRPGQKLRVLFCLDEACSLFKKDKEAYGNTGKAFSCIPKGLPIFCVVVDTSAQMQEPPPDRSTDPSLKFPKPETGRFPPICLVGVSWNNSEQLLLRLSETITGEDPTQPSQDSSRELYKWGRPLWRGALKYARLDDVVAFAVQKLLAGRTLSSVMQQYSPKLSVGLSMAILSVLAGWEVAPFTGLASEMVAAHMRTCTFISENRAQMYTADALEPILGEAACRVLHGEGILSEVLSKAVRLCTDTLAVEGSRGELVGRLYMVLAMNSCCCKRGSGGFNLYSHPVFAQDFLSELCGKQVKARGLVCFNRCLIVRRHKAISRRLLLLCFACAVCIIPAGNQEHFDILVPQLMPDADGKYQLLEEQMQAIPVQIRNRNSSAVDIECLREYAAFYQSFDAELISTCRERYEPEEVALDGASDIREETRTLHPWAASKHSDPTPDSAFNLLSEEVDMEMDLEYSGHSSEDQEKTDTDVGAVYLHLRGNAPRVEQEKEVLVVHGIHPNLVLSDKDTQTLRYFKLEDNYRDNDRVIRKMLPHYFLPLHPLSMDEVENLSVQNLQKILQKKLKRTKKRKWTKGDLVKKVKELITNGDVHLPKDPMEI